MSRSPDQLHHLANALSEDILAAPVEQLLAEAAEQDGDDVFLATLFDRISARATAQSRRRRIADRLRGLVASIVPRRSWRPAWAAVAALAVMVVAGDIYLHAWPDLLAPDFETARRDSASRMNARAFDRPASLDQEPGVVAGNAAAAPPASAAAPPVVASVPPPAPAAAAGVAVETKRARKSETRLGEADQNAASGPKPGPRLTAGTDQLQALADYQRARAALAAEDKIGARAPAAAPPVAAVATSTPAAAPNQPMARSAPTAARPDDAPSFIWPLPGRLIVYFGSAAGDRPNPGIDLAAPLGTDIHAAADGVVAYAGNELKGYGNLVLVRHRGDFVTAYAYASKLLVKTNDNVHSGQVIATSGQSGNAGAPLLHFEIRKGSTAVDPVPYLPPR
jgi:murein DD-endopeptidase MepM/ murein hydrolase activator NlpD